MKKNQKLKLLEALEKKDIPLSYEILLEAHKKGLGLISSAQRFALSHEKALEYAKNLNKVFIDEKALIIYHLSTKELIKDFIKNIYQKNQYALLSNQAINLRLKWASQDFIQLALDELEANRFLVKENKLYKNPNITVDIKQSLEDIILKRFQTETITPTAPYNIYDEMDLDRKTGDNILKTLCSKNLLKRVQHNIFIHTQTLEDMVQKMKNIINKDGYIDIKNFKANYPISRKYLISYLDYLDNYPDIKKDGNKRVFA